MKRNLFATAAGAALVVVACSAPVSNLPTHDLLNGNHAVPAGIITGTLVERSGCVSIQGEGDAVLVIWPRGYARLGQQIADDGYPIAQIGEFVTLGGGGIDSAQYERVRSAIGGSAIPGSCVSDSYWTATGVIPPDEN